MVSHAGDDLQHVRLVVGGAEHHRWLAIPAEEQPPNHYRLLGTKLFESSPDVIEAAAAGD